MVRLGALLGVFLVYYTIWMCVAPPKPAFEQENFQLFEVCQSNVPVFADVLLCLEAVLVLYGAYLAAAVRNLPSLFNEVTALLAAVYNVGILVSLQPC